MATIIPVINPKNLNDFKKKLSQLKGYDGLIQIDLSDGVFTHWKNYTNLSKIKDLKISLPFEIHFMFDKPEKYLEDLMFLKPKRLILHIESIKDFHKCYEICKANKVELALAICPETPINILFPYLNKLEMVLILAVIPGPSGQTMQHYVLENIPILKKKNKKIKVEMDGGLNIRTIETAMVFGVDYLAIGSAIFDSNRKPMEEIQFLNQEIKNIKKIKKIK
jgi:ribulose-phosphate 3-epimerase